MRSDLTRRVSGQGGPSSGTREQSEAGRRIVAVFAHPDDEAFGPAGTVARAVARGADAHLLCATRGEAGTIGRSARYAPGSLAALRTAELERAAATIGYRSLEILDYPDRGVAGVAPERGVADIEERLHDLRPDVVITFHPLGISGHPDHRAMTAMTTAAVERCRRRDGGGPRLHYYTVPASVARRVSFRDMPLVEDHDINVIIDTSDQVAVKHRAIECHRTQLAFYRRLMNLPDAHVRFDREAFTTHGVPGPVERPHDDLFADR